MATKNKTTNKRPTTARKARPKAAAPRKKTSRATKENQVSKKVTKALTGSVDEIVDIRENLKTSIADAIKNIVPIKAVTNLVDEIVKADESITKSVANAVKKVVAAVGDQLDQVSGQLGFDRA